MDLGSLIRLAMIAFSMLKITSGFKIFQENDPCMYHMLSLHFYKLMIKHVNGKSIICI